MNILFSVIVIVIGVVLPFLTFLYLTKWFDIGVKKAIKETCLLYEDCMNKKTIAIPLEERANLNKVFVRQFDKKYGLFSLIYALLFFGIWPLIYFALIPNYFDNLIWLWVLLGAALFGIFVIAPLDFKRLEKRVKNISTEEKTIEFSVFPFHIAHRIIWPTTLAYCSMAVLIAIYLIIGL